MQPLQRGLHIIMVLVACLDILNKGITKDDINRLWYHSKRAYD